MFADSGQRNPTQRKQDKGGRKEVNEQVFPAGYNGIATYHTERLGNDINIRDMDALPIGNLGKRWFKKAKGRKLT